MSTPRRGGSERPGVVPSRVCVAEDLAMHPVRENGRGLRVTTELPPDDRPCRFVTYSSPPIIVRPRGSIRRILGSTVVSRQQYAILDLRHRGNPLGVALQRRYIRDGKTPCCPRRPARVTHRWRCCPRRPPSTRSSRWRRRQSATTSRHRRDTGDGRSRSECDPGVTATLPVRYKAGVV